MTDKISAIKIICEQNKVLFEVIDDSFLRIYSNSFNESLIDKANLYEWMLKYTDEDSRLDTRKLLNFIDGGVVLAHIDIIEVKYKTGVH